MKNSLNDRFVSVCLKTNNYCITVNHSVFVIRPLLQTKILNLRLSDTCERSRSLHIHVETQKAQTDCYISDNYAMPGFILSRAVA